LQKKKPKFENLSTNGIEISMFVTHNVQFRAWDFAGHFDGHLSELKLKFPL
jgi:hypothetical protein